MNITLKKSVLVTTHVSNKEEMTDFLVSILGSRINPEARLLSSDFEAFDFPDGARITVFFTKDASQVLDEAHVKSGAWLELETDEPVQLKEKILKAGYSELKIWEGFFYFQLPGGQVMRIKMPA